MQALTPKVKRLAGYLAHTAAVLERGVDRGRELDVDVQWLEEGSR